MANPEHLEVLAQDVLKWNSWRRECRREHADIEPDFSGADLSGVNLSGADLEGADFSEANLSGAILLGTRLVGANLFRAHLSGAHFSGANIDRANFSEARVGRTIFADVDLSSAEGLDAVEHLAPSSIGIDTICRSEGMIPEVFLCGCGVPEPYITFHKSLVDNTFNRIAPLPFIEPNSSLFITYSHEDRPFARRLHDHLQARGIRCWLDEKPALPDGDIYEKVDRKMYLWDNKEVFPQKDQKIQNWKIRLYDKMLLCASKHSLTSWWADSELEAAFVKEWVLTRKAAPIKTALLLLNLDGFLHGEDWQSDKKEQVLSRLVADFTGWENDKAKFVENFELVVKVLHDGVEKIGLRAAHWKLTDSQHPKVQLNAARQRFMKFLERVTHLGLMTDTPKVQAILSSEYGIHLSEDEIRAHQERGPKWFQFGVIELWGTRQPQAALAWAASISWPNMGHVGLLQFLLNAARKTLPNLNRDMLDGMLPDETGKAMMLDLAEAATDPYSLANRILALTDLAERASRLKVLAQGWPDPEISTKWAQQSLSGADKMAFYSQVGYNLAHLNPQAALQVLAELKGTDTYASTFGAMMRGLVQIGGRGQQAAELIANSDLNDRERVRLISELARRWVRENADAASAWVNTLTAPDDIRAAIPLLVSQLDDDRVSRAVEDYLTSPDPVMELALIEAAAPPSLGINPQKSRLILDLLLNNDPGLKLRSIGFVHKGRMANKGELLWNSVIRTAKRQAEIGAPSDAMEWLGTLPFANQSDYAKAAGAVLMVWNLKSPTEAAEWLQNSTLDPAFKSRLQKNTQSSDT
jgi:Pentapeptide repeats (8 copies)/TIR domain